MLDMVSLKFRVPILILSIPSSSAYSDLSRSIECTQNTTIFPFLGVNRAPEHGWWMGFIGCINKALVQYYSLFGSSVVLIKAPMFIS